VKPSIVFVVGISSALAACVSTPTYTPRPTPLPPLVTYSKETQLRAADELSKLPEDSAIGKMIGDYGNLRKAIRHKKVAH
jgi:hypothetical protein